MSLRNFDGTLVASQVDGPTIVNNTPASILPPAAVIKLPPGYWDVGRKLTIHAMGKTTPVLSATTMRFDVRLGATVVFDTGALNNISAVGQSFPWRLNIELTCRIIGSAAQLMGIAKLQSEALVGAPANTAGGNTKLLAPVGAPALGTAFDATVAQTLDVFHTFGVSGADLTCNQYRADSNDAGYFVPGRRQLGLRARGTANFLIAGFARDASGNPLLSARILLYRVARPGELVAEQASSGVDGSYSFTVSDNGPYFIVAYKSGAPDVAGATPFTVIPTAI